MVEQRSGEEPLPEHEPPPMPRWVPLLIGAVLVAIAALAVYTGTRYRNKPDDRPVEFKPAASRPAAEYGGGAPGEPQAGASRILHGDSGEHAPAADPMDPGRSRVTIAGGREGVTAVVRYSARRGVSFQTQPPDALIYVNDHEIGPANQFAGPDEIYEFPEQGKFTVRIAAPGFVDSILVVNADPAAPVEVVRVVRALEPI